MLEMEKKKSDDIDKSLVEDTALIAAATRGHAECVRVLSKTKELCMKDMYGHTALFKAIIFSNTECVDILKNTREALPKHLSGYTVKKLQHMNYGSLNELRVCMTYMNVSRYNGLTYSS